MVTVVSMEAVSLTRQRRSNGAGLEPLAGGGAPASFRGQLNSRTLR